MSPRCHLPKKKFVVFIKFQLILRPHVPGPHKNNFSKPNRTNVQKRQNVLKNKVGALQTHQGIRNHNNQGNMLLV